MAKRRPSGDGMVRKKEDGSWEGRVVIGYDEKNLPKTKNVLAKTKSECVEKLKQLQEQYAPPKSDKIKLEMPFGEWMDFWYQNYSKPKLRPTTRSGYEGRIYRHIISELGNIPLDQLTQNDLQQFYARLKKSGRLLHAEHYGKGLSDRMVRASTPPAGRSGEGSAGGADPHEPRRRMQAAAQESTGDAGADP